MRTVVKVQRPIEPPNAPWYVYDERKLIRQLITPSHDVLRQMGQDSKGYFNADYKAGKLHILDRVGNRNW